MAEKFASLLPEVEKRKLYEEYGFYSIYEFAAKLAGLSHASVTEILRINRKLEDKPQLQNLIQEEGWSKLKVVANICEGDKERNRGSERTFRGTPRGGTGIVSTNEKKVKFRTR